MCLNLTDLDFQGTGPFQTQKPLVGNVVSYGCLHTTSTSTFRIPTFKGVGMNKERWWWWATGSFSRGVDRLGLDLSQEKLKVDYFFVLFL